LVSVSVLQFIGNLTDRQAAEAVRCRIDWKYALGLELDDPGFDHSVLGEFRDRIAEGDRADRLLGLFVGRLVEAGLVRGGGRQRTDSSHVLAAVRTLNRAELVGETSRCALEALAGRDEVSLAGVRLAPRHRNKTLTCLAEPSRWSVRNARRCGGSGSACPSRPGTTCD